MQPESHRMIVSDLLEGGTPVRFQAGGPSMSPTIRDGEAVSVRPVRPGDLRPGALLLFRQHNRLALHRLVKKQDGLFFCGDAALSGLERAVPEEVLGTAVAVHRAGAAIELNTVRQRRAGMLRYRLRPLRRLLIHMLKR